MITAHALVLLGFLGASSTPDIQDSQDRAAAVADLLAERCARCHGPDSDTPKATRHWPDAEDLAETVQNEDLIVAGEPDSSGLFLAISFEDMPPPDSEVAPLSDDEKAMIADWIRDGAAVPAVLETEPPSVDPAPEARGWMQRPFARWASHFHPMIVHFPVALLVSALLAELLARLSNSPGMRTAASFCLTVGALSALPAAGLGWLLAENTSHPGGALLWHRWLGISTAILSLVTLRVGRGRPTLRLVLLLMIAALVGATGHLGGTLSYGADWLDWPG